MDDPRDPAGGRFWTAPLQEILRALDTDGAGLSSSEARLRELRFGPNEPARRRRSADLLEALRRIFNPLVIILLISGVISALLGERANAAIIVALVIASATIDLVEARRSRRAAEELRRRVEVQATARRDGRWVSISLRDVVPGDRIRLAIGDIVPADARVLDGNALFADEAAFTGESLPVEKRPADAVTGPLPAEATNSVFMGTVINGGTGEAVVVRTGRATTFAHIAEQLDARVPETEFDRGLWVFGRLIARTVVALVLFVVLVNVLAKRDPLESVVFAVALAVGLTPELLPMIMSATLAEGALRMARARVIVRQLAAIQNFGSLDVLCSDKTGTLTEGRMEVACAVDADGTTSDRVLRLAVANAQHQTGLRNPFDDALREASRDGAMRVMGEIPFDFARRRLSVAVEMGSGRVLVTKGAPESVLDVCRSARRADAVELLDGGGRSRIEAQVTSLGAQGFRLLAVASRPVLQAGPLQVGDETEMTFEGLVGFNDPLKVEVAEVVQTLRRDGIRLKILTGDAEAVTRHVCTRIGQTADEIVSGPRLDTLNDTALQDLVERVDVFARVTPEQKLRLIRALQHHGHVVGYLGDGINDAPALRAADVGISVAGAVDVAREAAQIVLLEKSLQVLHDGVMQGRQTFGNVIKYIMMGTSSNFGNMLSMAGAVLFLPFLPLLPKQVLLNNVLYDMAQLTIPKDAVDSALVRKPRRWDMRFIRDFMLVFGPISSLYDFLTFGVLLYLFRAHEALFHTGWFVESLATQTLVIFVIRTAGSPLRSPPSPLLIGSVGLVVAIGLLLPWTPLAAPLGFVAPPVGFMVYVAGAILTYLALVDIAKRLFFRLHPTWH